MKNIILCYICGVSIHDCSPPISQSVSPKRGRKSKFVLFAKRLTLLRDFLMVKALRHLHRKWKGERRRKTRGTEAAYFPVCP